MFIQLDDKYAIKTDVNQYMLCYSVPKTKKNDGWKPFKYFTNLENCVQTAAEVMLRTSDASGVHEVLEENKRILRQLAGALTPHFKVTVEE